MIRPIDLASWVVVHCDCCPSMSASTAAVAYCVKSWRLTPVVKWHVVGTSLIVVGGTRRK